MAGIFEGGLDGRDVATNNLISEAAALMVLLHQLCGDALGAYLTGRSGPVVAGGASQAFLQGLAHQLVQPNAKLVKAFLQQGLRDAKAAGRVWP